MDMQALMKMAQQMQDQLKSKQDQLQNAVYEGDAGAGMVKVSMNGRFEVLSVAIEPTLLKGEDASMLEDLTRAAFNSAAYKVNEAAGSSLGSMGQSLGIDLSSIFGQTGGGGDTGSGGSL